MDQSGPTVAGVNEHTLPHIQRQPNNAVNMGYMDEHGYGSHNKLPVSVFSKTMLIII